MTDPREDDPEDQQQPPFRWNRQAVFMVVIFLFAMALPLLGVAWFARGYLPSAPPVVANTPVAKDVPESPGLRAALESAAADSLQVGPISVKRAVLSIPVAEANRDEKVRTLKDFVSRRGGSLVEMETGRRFLVTGPPGIFDAANAVLGAGGGRPTPAADGEGLFEVRLEMP